MNILRWILSVAFIINTHTLFSQEISAGSGKSEARVVADSLFKAGDYAKALPIFKELLDSYPQEAYYNYGVGVCMLNTSSNAEAAITYLSKASSGDVPNKVYFFLAQAFRKTYQFDKAIEYYRRFTVNGGFPDVKTVEIEKDLSICENGNSLLKYFYSPQVIDKKRVSVSEFYQYYTIIPKSLSVLPLSDNLKSETDRKQDGASLMVSPSNPQEGDYIYFSSYGKSTINGKDIYRIKKLADGYWSKPENLGLVINTAEDEDFPYIAPDGITLYFASKGHYSMGGYDIYRSVYDAGSKRWSNPENLGFPFSSTFDDMLYIPDSADSLACFATNRNCNPDSVDVVMFKVDKNPIQRSFTTVDEVQDVALLNVVKEKISSVSKSDEVKQNKEVEVKTEVKTKPKSASFNAVENDPEYVRVITNGFIKQKETDSLRIKLEKLRERFDYINTAEERKSLESKVVKVENALLAAQGEADKLFAQASQIEQDYLTGKRKPQGPSNANFTNDNPDFLYQAQFASTVFRSDEVNKLTQIEKLQGQISTARDEASAARSKYLACVDKNDSTINCNDLQKQANVKMNAYSSLIAKMFDVKYKIYSDCVMVAIVKSGNNNGDDARAEVERANNHFRAATTIKNNLSEEGRNESLFEASLLNELGILRMELAFARTWGMNLFEQQSTSKVIKLEKLAFGNPLAPVVSKPEVVEVQKTIPETKQNVAIAKVEQKNITSEPIVIKEDEPLAFQVSEKSPYDVQNPIPVNEALPNGVIYKIQLGAFSRVLEIASFKGMNPVSIERPEGAKVSKYYIGRFRRFSEAEQALTTVRTKAFKDAFIVAWLDGKSIPVSRAQSMEGKSSPLSQKNVVAADSSTLKGKIYQVQIGKYNSKIPDGVLQTVKAMAAGKDVFRKTNEQGLIVYSIGNYNSVDEANRVKDNLIASGVSTAEVVTLEIDKK